jgi:hypothetical protein
MTNNQIEHMGFGRVIQLNYQIDTVDHPEWTFSLVNRQWIFHQFYVAAVVHEFTRGWHLGQNLNKKRSKPVIYNCLVSCYKYTRNSILGNSFWK